MTPCESWPARLALTQPVATAPASSSDAPAALSSAAPMRARRSAWTIGMGVPRDQCPRESGSCLLSPGSCLWLMVSKRWADGNDLEPEICPCATQPGPLRPGITDGWRAPGRRPVKLKMEPDFFEFFAACCWRAVYCESQLAPLLTAT